MGLRDIIKADSTSHFFDVDEFAETISYVSAATVPFSAAVVFEDVFTLDEQLERHIVNDSARCVIQHSVLSAQSITEPAIQYSGVTGDTIIRTDHNGDDETWIIVGKEFDSVFEEWKLDLAKDTRIVP